MAEWARLLSECRGNLVAGSNPALPATRNTLSGVFFVFLVARPRREDDIRIPAFPPQKTCSARSTFFVLYESRVSAEEMIFASRPPRHENTSDESDVFSFSF